MCDYAAIVDALVSTVLAEREASKWRKVAEEGEEFGEDEGEEGDEEESDGGEGGWHDTRRPGTETRSVTTADVLLGSASDAENEGDLQEGLRFWDEGSSRTSAGKATAGVEAHEEETEGFDSEAEGDVSGVGQDEGEESMGEEEEGEGGGPGILATHDWISVDGTFATVAVIVPKEGSTRDADSYVYVHPESNLYTEKNFARAVKPHGDMLLVGGCTLSDNFSSQTSLVQERKRRRIIRHQALRLCLGGADPSSIR